jgi:hypothetical protein
MDQAALVGLDVEAGKEILRLLDDAKFRVVAALWRYASESEDWRLLIATPIVDRYGKLAAYQRLDRIIRTNAPHLLLAPRVTLVGSKDKLIRGLRRIFGKAASIDGMRLGNNFIDGEFLEAAYVYRIKP